MPELPEVETVRKGLAASIIGQKCVAVSVRCRDFRLHLPESFEASIEGRVITGIGRRAKYLLVYLDGDQILLIHLGMSGRMLVGSSSEPKTHDHVIFDLGDGRRLIFNDPRRFGLLDVVKKSMLMQHKLLRHLGPEPLGNEFNGQVLSKVLAGRKSSIKSLLLDQKIVAGLGNIYACESLFASQISPRRTGSSVVGVRAERLVQAIRSVLIDAIAAGGSTLRDFVTTDGGLGYFQHQFKVYGRAGQVCPTNKKGHLVLRLVQSNRSTFYCSKCQR